MALKNIVVEGCELEFENGGNDSSITINPTPSQVSAKVKADGKGVYKTLMFTIAGYTASSSVSPNWVSESGTGVGAITASAEHVTVEGNPAILEEDESEEIVITGLEQEGDTQVVATVTEVVKVKKAGQKKVKGS